MKHAWALAVVGLLACHHEVGTATPPAECARASDCAIEAISCCGSCGQPTVGDARAYAVASPPAPSAECADQSCPECEQDPDPRLAVDCVRGQCVLTERVGPR
jgi:hypothetical protein